MYLEPLPKVSPGNLPFDSNAHCRELRWSKRTTATMPVEACVPMDAKLRTVCGLEREASLGRLLRLSSRRLRCPPFVHMFAMTQLSSIVSSILQNPTLFGYGGNGTWKPCIVSSCRSIFQIGSHKFDDRWTPNMKFESSSLSHSLTTPEMALKLLELVSVSGAARESKSDVPCVSEWPALLLLCGFSPCTRQS